MTDDRTLEAIDTAVAKIILEGLTADRGPDEIPLGLLEVARKYLSSKGFAGVSVPTMAKEHGLDLPSEEEIRSYFRAVD